MSHRCRIMKKLQAPPVRRRRRPRQGSSSERDPQGTDRPRPDMQVVVAGAGPGVAGGGAPDFRVLAGGAWAGDRGLIGGFAGGLGFCGVACAGASLGCVLIGGFARGSGLQGVGAFSVRTTGLGGSDRGALAVSSVGAAPCRSVLVGQKPSDGCLRRDTFRLPIRAYAWVPVLRQGVSSGGCRGGGGNDKVAAPFSRKGIKAQVR